MWQFGILLAPVDLCIIICLQSHSILVVCNCKYEDNQTIFASMLCHCAEHTLRGVQVSASKTTRELIFHAVYATGIQRVDTEY